MDEEGKLRSEWKSSLDLNGISESVTAKRNENFDSFFVFQPYRPFPLLMKIFHHALKRNDIQFSSDQQ